MSANDAGRDMGVIFGAGGDAGGSGGILSGSGGDLGTGGGSGGFTGSGGSGGVIGSGGAGGITGSGGTTGTGGSGGAVSSGGTTGSGGTGGAVMPDAGRPETMMGMDAAGGTGGTDAGTPVTCANAPAYVLGTQYMPGARARNVGSLYQCRPYPYSGWCGQHPAYEPGVGYAWMDAWTLVGRCQ